MPFQNQTPILKFKTINEKIKEDEEEKTQPVTRSEINGETTEGWGHDLGFTYLIFLKIEHYWRVELRCRWWWLVKWTLSFTGDVDKTTPWQSNSSPSHVRSYTVANLRLQVVSSVMGLDNNGGVRGWEIGSSVVGLWQQWWHARVGD